MVTVVNIDNPQYYVGQTSLPARIGVFPSEHIVYEVYGCLDFAALRFCGS
jgi:hypothetical protein